MCVHIPKAKRDMNQGQGVSTEEQQTEDEETAHKTRRLTPGIIVLIVVLILCLIGAGIGIVYLVTTASQIESADSTTSAQPATPTAKDSGKTVDNPIDFTSLKKKNSDIYAWIYVPGTKINYAICQNSENGYYLTHDVSKKETQVGAIFSENANAKDFDDPVTILYGHNGYGDTMFSTLHDYEDATFFKEHPYFYIYMPKHIYTYKIVSSYVSDNHNIMSVYDFTEESQVKAFQKKLENPDSITEQVDKSVKLKASDKTVVLSTCNTGVYEATGRYLVSGVRTGDQRTN